MRSPKHLKELNARNDDTLHAAVDNALRAALASLQYDGVKAPNKHSPEGWMLRAAIARTVLEANPEKE